jgi:hypothetical protein
MDALIARAASHQAMLDSNTVSVDTSRNAINIGSSAEWTRYAAGAFTEPGLTAFYAHVMSFARLLSRAHLDYSWCFLGNFAVLCSILPNSLF